MSLPASGPLCTQCRHIRRDYTCTAFLRGIPTLIAFQGHDHTVNVPGDHGIKFEARRPGDPEPDFIDLELPEMEQRDP